MCGNFETEQYINEASIPLYYITKMDEKNKLWPFSPLVKMGKALVHSNLYEILFKGVGAP